MRQQANTKVVAFLILISAAVACPEDFTTINGKEYNDAIVTRVEPDGIVLKTKSGVTKVYFTELPKDVQERFHYSSEKAASYSADQTANYTAYEKQQQEARRQEQDAAAKKNAALAEQQTATNRTQSLRDRYADLQKQEDQLLLQIGEAKKPGPEYREGKSLRHHPNPLASQLPLLQSHLSDVRREKSEVRRQLEKTQR
jgi:hypothetical protein